MKQKFRTRTRGTKRQIGKPFPIRNTSQQVGKKRLRSIVTTNRKLFGKKFTGMNYYAAKELGLRYPFSKETLWVWDNEREKELTIRHEKREAELMKQGLDYKHAHAKTLLELESQRYTKRSAWEEAKSLSTKESDTHGKNV